MKDASKVVLSDLAFVQRPPMVLVLTDVKPRFRIPDWRRPALLESRVDADMQPDARGTAPLSRAPADPVLR
jgi:hypothetical protein